MFEKYRWILIVAVMVFGGLGVLAGGQKMLGGWLRDGRYIDQRGNPVNLKYCSTGWKEVPKSDPKRYSCSGTVTGDGPLCLERKCRAD